MNLPPLQSIDRSPPKFPQNQTGDLLDRMQTSAPVPGNDSTIKDDNADLSKIGLGVVSKMSPSSELGKSVSDNPSARIEKVQVPTKVQQKPPVKKRRPRKKWKKPKDKPNRPLSAYNLFFQQERAAMVGESNSNDSKTATTAVDSNDSDEGSSDKNTQSGGDANNKRRVHRKTHGKIGFAEMARSIGAKWKILPAVDKEVFEKQAAKEKARYAKELATWKEQQKLKEQQLEKRNQETSEAKPAESGNAGNGAADPSIMKNQMVADGVSRQRMSMLQDSTGAQELFTIDYLRALHGRQQMSDADGMNTYPNAAEASANAILQQYQGMLSHHPSPAGPGQLNPYLFSSGTGFAGNPSMSLAEQLQMNTAAQRQMQIERFQVQQLLLQNHLASQQQQQHHQQSAQAPAGIDTIQQQLSQQYRSNAANGRGFPRQPQQHP